MAGYNLTADKISGNVNGNGDDGYFLYYGTSQATGVLFDAFGVINQDGTGFAWEYEDSKATRKRTVTNPNPTWTESEWVIPAAAATKDMTPDYHAGSITWQGTVSTSWNAKGTNWDSPNGYIPDASCVVTIPAVANSPIITEPSAVHSVEIQTGASLSIQNTGSLKIVGQ